MTTPLATLLVVVFAVSGLAKIAAVPVMQTAARHFGFSVVQYRVLGAVELAGALGIVVGRALTPIGGAAGIGLGLLLLGAAGAHAVRHDPVPRIAFPLLVAAVDAAYVLSLR